MGLAISDLRSPATIHFKEVKVGGFFECRENILWLRITNDDEHAPSGRAVRLATGAVHYFKYIDSVKPIEEIEIRIVK